MLTDNQIEAFEFLMKKANIEYGQTYKIECDLFNGSFIIEKKKKEICVDYKNKNDEWETYILTEFEDDRILNLLFYHSNNISLSFWVPNKGQRYYYIDQEINNSEYYIKESIWMGLKDKALFLTGSLFKTYEDARKNMNKVIEVYERNIGGYIEPLVYLNKK